MSAFKIRHKATGKFLSTTASTRYLTLYFGDYGYNVEDGITTKGRVYSTERGAQNTLDRLEKYPLSKGQFELYELN